MSEELKTQMKRFYEEVFNGHDVDAIDELAHEDVIEHEPFPGEFSPGREGVKEIFRGMFAAIPNITATVEDMACENDKVWTRVRVRGTQTGDFFGIPATGKAFDIEAIDVVRFRGDKAAEHWGLTDLAGMLTQVGLLQPPG